MKPSLLIQAFTLTTVLLTGTASADSANLIQNGNFELTVFGTFTGYRIANAGTPSIANWTISGASVDVIRDNFGAVSGNSIDLLGTPGPGSLSQGFSTIAGQHYQIRFDLSANGVGGDSKELSVSIGNNATYHYFGDMNHNVTETFTYQAATTGMTNLTFTSAASGYSGAVIDNVAVTAAVPEPENYATLIAGLGLLGFMARRKPK